MSVEATLIIEPEDGGTQDAIVIAELDDAMNVDSSGEVVTSFGPGDQIYFRTHISREVQITDIIATDGSIRSFGAASRNTTEEFVFASRDPLEPPQHSLSRVPSGSLSFKYIGRSGSVSRSQTSNGVMTLQGDVNQVPYICEVSYNYACKSYLLQAPNVTLGEDETYHIVVVVYTRSTVGVEDACSSS